MNSKINIFNSIIILISIIQSISLMMAIIFSIHKNYLNSLLIDTSFNISIVTMLLFAITMVSIMKNYRRLSIFLLIIHISMTLIEIFTFIYMVNIIDFFSINRLTTINIHENLKVLRDLLIFDSLSSVFKIIIESMAYILIIIYLNKTRTNSLVNKNFHRLDNENEL